MPNYVIAYLGGKEPESPEAGAKHMEKWKAWLADLGDAVVNPGTPLGNSKIVSADGVSDVDPSTRLMGFSIVTAESMDSALGMAQACPFLDMGTLQVGEVMEMK